MATLSQLHQNWKPFSLTHITYPINLPSPLQSYLAKLLALLSLTPPFTVCSLTVATLFYKDVLAAYLLVGSLSSILVSAIVKKAVKHPRPPRYDDEILRDGTSSLIEGEYGMPSNHACFVWFGAAFFVLYVLRGGNVWMATKLPSSSSSSLPSASSSCNGSSGEESSNGHAATLSSTTTSYTWTMSVWYHLHTTLIVVASLLIAGGCAYSRVYLGYHTPVQVLAGSLLGMLSGILWYTLFETEVVRGLLIKLDGTLYELECGRRDQLINSMMCLGDSNNDNGGGMKRD